MLIHFPKCNIGLQNLLLTDGPTDRRTYRQTDIVLYRAAIAAKNKKYKKSGQSNKRFGSTSRPALVGLQTTLRIQVVED